MRSMRPEEIEGVLAHEVAHIRNRDVRLMTLVALLVGVIALLADILLRMAFFGGGKRGSNPIITIVAFGALLLAPIAGIVIQLAVSRRREYLADASAAEITNDAEGMALALRRLQIDQTEIRNASRATAHMYIESPLRQAHGPRASLSGLFSTHPPLEKRIAALEEAGGFRLAAA
jgi:heat shock protein HtpX